MCKQISLNSFENKVIYRLLTYKSYIIYVNKKDLTLTHNSWYDIKPNIQTKLKPKKQIWNMAF